LPKWRSESGSGSIIRLEVETPARLTTYPEKQILSHNKGMTTTVYTRKAQLYAQHRWDYAPQAIETIFATVPLTYGSIVADLGAGTGILTRHFAGRAGYVFAIEPNRAMQMAGNERLCADKGVVAITATAEAVPLAGHSVDLVTVAQAIHWFQPEAAREEILRILKPAGWLVLIHNRPVATPISQATAGLLTPEFGICTAEQPPALHVPSCYYFSGAMDDPQACMTIQFPFQFFQNWEAYWGSMQSASFVPEEDHPAFRSLEAAAQKVFEQYSSGGLAECRGVTILTIGQPN
jgi:ubiquinone/menaquinone biosynthesis C-methylase UbiE